MKSTECKRKEEVLADWREKFKTVADTKELNEKIEVILYRN
jgi:hypothetical protein